MKRHHNHPIEAVDYVDSVCEGVGVTDDDRLVAGILIHVHDAGRSGCRVVRVGMDLDDLADLMATLVITKESLWYLKTHPDADEGSSEEMDRFVRDRLSMTRDAVALFLNGSD